MYKTKHTSSLKRKNLAGKSKRKSPAGNTPKRQSSKKFSTRGGSFSTTNRPDAGGNMKFSRNRGRKSGGGGGNRGKKRGMKTMNMPMSTFIKKADLLTESVEQFVPTLSFATLPIDATLKRNILTKNYEHPTPIQDKIIPHIFEGKDVVGLANTGTGKTAAFLIPLINKVILNREEKVIILTPTRELAIQIEEELKSFTKNMPIFSTVCVGGAPIYPQITSLRRSNQFIIGTPGRVMDLMRRGNLKLEGFKTIVLDEADRMLDMGFINDMLFVMAEMPKERHTLFFSATMSPVIKGLIKDFLKDPVSISVKTQDTAKNVDQDVVRVQGEDKINILEKLLADPEFSKVLVFGRTKHGVEKLSKALIKRGIKSESIHGNKSHSQRQRSLKKFKTDEVQTLIATDVVARGLDISNVSHVINYELPETYDDYVHRIGRTGRGDKTGKALTFVD